MRDGHFHRALHLRERKAVERKYAFYGSEADMPSQLVYARQMRSHLPRLSSENTHATDLCTDLTPYFGGDTYSVTSYTSCAHRHWYVPPAHLPILIFSSPSFTSTF